MRLNTWKGLFGAMFLTSVLLFSMAVVIAVSFDAWGDSSVTERVVILACLMVGVWSLTQCVKYWHSEYKWYKENDEHD